MIRTISDISAGFVKRKKTAMIYKTGFRTFRLSYGQLHTSVLKTCTLFEQLGLGKGDKILIWGYNCPQWGILFLAATKMGVVVVPIDYMANSDFVKKIQVAVQPKILFHSEFKLPPAGPIQAFLLEHLDRYISSLSKSQRAYEIREDDLAEIVYTSGTTGAPKGVMLTHKNIVSNVRSVINLSGISSEQTFLSVLPLSHLFEQNPGFLALLESGCTIVYIRGLRPSLIFKTLEQERVTNMILVPRLLKLFADGVMRQVEAEHKTKLFNKLLTIKASKKIKQLLFRAVHKKFGYHFQYFVVGGGPFASELESFWFNLGFTTLQGYGLTECSPVLTGNSIKQQKLGSVGKAVQGVTLKIGGDGEIWAKGDNVFKGYFQNKTETHSLFANGWMRTGDIGSIDKDGYVFLKGRKKDVIVLSSGVNIYPEDIEQILLKQAGVSDVCVLGLPIDNEEIVHAEILLKEWANVRDVVDAANQLLGESQQITSYAKWPKEDFPRTTTMKIQKRFVLDEVLKRGKNTADKITQNHPKIYLMLSRISKVDADQIKPSTKLALDLHLGSINRIELISLLEQEYNLDINEDEITADTTVSDLEAIVKDRQQFKQKNIFRRWLLCDSIRIVRFIYNALLADNVIRLFCRRTVIGRENLENLKQPVIFIANHVGYFDTPNIYMSLPFAIRNKIAVAAWKEYFDIPKRETLKRMLYWVYFEHASLFSNIFLFPKKKGFKKSLEYTGELLDKGWNILFFPEGEHSPSGKLQPFRSGIGWLVKEMRVPVIPIKHSGLERIMAGDQHQIPRFGRVTVTIGKPLEIDYTKSVPEITNELQQIIQKM